MGVPVIEGDASNGGLLVDFLALEGHAVGATMSAC
jgi:hypothetical protein